MLGRRRHLAITPWNGAVGHRILAPENRTSKLNALTIQKWNHLIEPDLKPMNTATPVTFLFATLAVACPAAAMSPSQSADMRSVDLRSLFHGDAAGKFLWSDLFGLERKVQGA